MQKPIVWTIAGSDSGGGAGIQADLHTMQALGVHGCSVITAVTAQNSHEVTAIEWLGPEIISAQLTALQQDLPASVVKLGMLGNSEAIKIVATFLQNFTGTVVCDPVMVASSGAQLFAAEAKQLFCELILPYVTVLTPNLPEVSALLDETNLGIEAAAKKLLALGPRQVVIKGGHDSGEYCQDYWTDGTESAWLTLPRQAHENNHGSGCTLSSALAALLAQEYSPLDALVVAKMYVSQGIRHAQQYGQGPGPIAPLAWPTAQQDLPWLTATADFKRPVFADRGSEPLGFYPIVDSAKWLEKLLPLGVKTIQLRIKNSTEEILEQEIKTSVALAKQYQARLFINDYWKLAIKYGAYGVHLGQEDLSAANVQTIAAAGLRLGISTHCYAEVARAHAFRPTYMACGPIYSTTSKAMAFAPQGLENLHRWQQTLDYPLVAIGGISLARLPAVLATGVESAAVISAVTVAAVPEQVTQQFLKVF